MADPSGGADEFDDAVAQFLREYFEAEPVGASFYGLTEWDGLLPDMTAGGFADREAAVQRLGQVPHALHAGRENLDPALVDAELVRQWAKPAVATSRPRWACNRARSTS